MTNEDRILEIRGKKKGRYGTKLSVGVAFDDVIYVYVGIRRRLSIPCTQVPGHQYPASDYGWAVKCLYHGLLRL